jgi:hypothetical protein
VTGLLVHIGQKEKIAPGIANCFFLGIISDKKHMSDDVYSLVIALILKEFNFYTNLLVV